ELSKLVPSIRRHLVHIFPRLESAVNSQPSNTHPAILTANVPYGNPSSLLRWQPCHRSQTTAAITHKTCIAFPLRYINYLSYVSDTVSYSTLHIRKIRALQQKNACQGHSCSAHPRQASSGSYGEWHHLFHWLRSLQYSGVNSSHPGIPDHTSKKHRD